jgi:hypothetical protein
VTAANITSSCNCSSRPLGYSSRVRTSSGVGGRCSPVVATMRWARSAGLVPDPAPPHRLPDAARSTV